MGTIVVGVDGSGAADAALRWATAEAAAKGESILAVTAWSFPPVAALPIPAPSYAELRDAAHETSEKALAGVALDDAPVASKVVEGAAASVLSDLAGPDDLLVVGARGVGGFEGLLLGSVSRAVLHRARSRVVVVHAGMTYERAHDDEPPMVLVGVDASSNAHRAVALAAEEAARRHGRCLAVHVCQVGLTAAPEGEDLLRPDDAALDVDRRVVAGNPARTLVDLSAAADLLVVGTTGHGALSAMVLGSVSTACAERAACPVLVVPPG